METVVIFNMGRDAKRAGGPRVAPDQVDYPMRSQYVPDHTKRYNLSDYMKRAWLEGYDWKPGGAARRP